MKKILFILCIFLLTACGQIEKNTENPQRFFAVVPHHNLANSYIDDFYETLAKKYPSTQNIVIISPNHFGQEDMISFPKSGKFCFEKSCIEGFSLPFSSSEKNKIFTKKGENWQTREHGIGNHFAFIKKYFPNTKTSVLLLKIDMRFAKRHEEMVEKLQKYNFDGDTLFIASIDASHHTQEKMAYFHDLNTLQMLESEENTPIEVDCPSCLFSVKTLAKNHGKPFFQLKNRTSVDSILNINSNFENTSHLYGIFENKKDDTWKQNFLSHFKKRKLEKNYENTSFTLTPKITNPESLRCFYSHKNPKRNPKYWHNRLFYSIKENFTPKSDAVKVSLLKDLGLTFFDKKESESLLKRLPAIKIKSPMKYQNMIFIGNIENRILYYDELFYKIDKNGVIDCESFE